MVKEGKAMNVGILTLDPANQLETKSFDELMYETYIPKKELVEGILPEGLIIMAGGPKTGKSFMVLQMGYHVSKGSTLWERKVSQGDVLYLALEDDYPRLQQRAFTMFGVEENPNFHLAIKADNMDGQLILQISEFIKTHPNTKLVIIDTLQKIRKSEGESQSYASDYAVISQLKALADELRICILVVHHTRKQGADDAFDMISGTNGLLGSADGAIIVMRKHNEKTAKVEISGRDLPGQTLHFRFDDEKCVWCLVKTEAGLIEKVEDPILIKVKDFFADGKTEWEGTASELMELLTIEDFTPANFSKFLSVNNGNLINLYGLCFERKDRTKAKRGIQISRYNG